MGSHGLTVFQAIAKLVSIQLVSPASGELHYCTEASVLAAILDPVSIQLVSPASGESISIRSRGPPLSPIVRVSIQLVSPASGEGRAAKWSCCISKSSFHSISFPSEWGGFGQRVFENGGLVEFPFN